VYTSCDRVKDFLAKAGLSVLLLERLDQTGGAAISAPVFSGLDARLSRYSYLVSLLPEQIIEDLDLRLELRSRRTASYTPVVRDGKHTGLLVERPEGTLTAESFKALTGSDAEYDAWRAFYGEVTDFAEASFAALAAADEEGDASRSRRDLDALVAQPLGKVSRSASPMTRCAAWSPRTLISTFAG
jgi:phytoene dehydrogenase-like protein